MKNMYEAEVAVLGSLIIEPGLMDECYLMPEEFAADERHPVIFEYLKYTYEQEGTIDIALMAANSGTKLMRIGGISYLMEIRSAVPSSANFDKYQAAIRKSYIKRKSSEIMQAMSKMALADNVDAKQHLEQARARLEELSEMMPKEKGAGLVRMNEVLEDHVDLIVERGEQQGMTGPPTISRYLDKLTGGHQAGDLEIVAARPSMGKTAYMNNDAIKVAQSGAVAAIFSAEMTALSVVERVICSLANLDSHKMRSGAFTEEDWKRYSFAREELDRLPLYIDETPGMTLQHIKTETKRLVKAHPDKRIVVYIDYLQLIPAGIKFNSRNEEVGYISRQLKIMAREHGITVVALSQLSRKVEERQNKRPLLSDIRESGEIEQNADIITFLYRDDYYNPESDKPGIIELIVAKGRNIGTGTVEMAFLRQFSKFVDLDYGADANGAATAN